MTDASASWYMINSGLEYVGPCVLSVYDTLGHLIMSRYMRTVEPNTAENVVMGERSLRYTPVTPI